MNRLAVGTLLVAILSSVGGCGPADDSSMPYYGTGYGSGGPYCSQYTSCGTCTPIVGCGWCANADGTGSCAPGPDNCTTDWIWEPNFCPANSAPAAGGAAGGPVDAATPGASDSDDVALLPPISDAAALFPDAGASSESDAETDAAVDAALDQATSSNPPPIIADGGGCSNNGGSLCGASQPFGLTCVQTSVSGAVPEPPPSLECSVVDAPTPAGTLFYCCSVEPAGDLVISVPPR